MHSQAITDSSSKDMVSSMFLYAYAVHLYLHTLVRLSVVYNMKRLSPDRCTILRVIMSQWDLALNHLRCLCCTVSKGSFIDFRARSPNPSSLYPAVHTGTMLCVLQWWCRTILLLIINRPTKRTKTRSSRYQTLVYHWHPNHKHVYISNDWWQYE